MALRAPLIVIPAHSSLPRGCQNIFVTNSHSGGERQKNVCEKFGDNEIWKYSRIQATKPNVHIVGRERVGGGTLGQLETGKPLKISMKPKHRNKKSLITEKLPNIVIKIANLTLDNTAKYSYTHELIFLFSF